MLDVDKLFNQITKKITPPPQQTTFSIPVNHPAADKLRKLMICLQTSVKTPSGLQLQYREDDPSAVEEMLDALRSVLMAEGVESPALNTLTNQQQAQPLTMSLLFQTMIQTLGHNNS